MPSEGVVGWVTTAGEKLAQTRNLKLGRGRAATRRHRVLRVRSMLALNFFRTRNRVREIAQGGGMELLKFILLLIGLGVFAAVILSTLVVVFVVAISGWIAAFTKSFLTGEGKSRERAPKVRQIAGQEGT